VCRSGVFGEPQSLGSNQPQARYGGAFTLVYTGDIYETGTGVGRQTWKLSVADLSAHLDIVKRASIEQASASRMCLMKTTRPRWSLRTLGRETHSATYFMVSEKHRVSQVLRRCP
jgi:hypothetical protein